MGEIPWTAKVTKTWTAVGAVVVVNKMGRHASHVSDRTLICVKGIYYIEFKGVTTPISDGQKLWMRKANRNEKCAFVYRQPNVRGDLNGIVQTCEGVTLCKTPIGASPRQLWDIFASLRSQF